MNPSQQHNTTQQYTTGVNTATQQHTTGVNTTAQQHTTDVDSDEASSGGLTDCEIIDDSSDDLLISSPCSAVDADAHTPAVGDVGECLHTSNTATADINDQGLCDVINDTSDCCGGDSEGWEHVSPSSVKIYDVETVDVVVNGEINVVISNENVEEIIHDDVYTIDTSIPVDILQDNNCQNDNLISSDKIASPCHTADDICHKIDSPCHTADDIYVDTTVIERGINSVNNCIPHDIDVMMADEETLLLTPESQEHWEPYDCHKDTSPIDNTNDVDNILNGKAVTLSSDSSEISKDIERANTALELEAARKPLRPLFEGCCSVQKFKKLNKISEGTYGAVYRAEDLETNEIVALKLVKYHEKVWAEGVPVPALREVSILLELNAPNIICVKEVAVGSRDNQVFMVMEYVEHEFGYLLHQRKPEFSTAERKCLLRQLLEAIQYLHDNWVIHRDLKTSNLLYSNKGVLKVCDFGMSRKFGEPVRPYTRNVVTLWYRAPELMLPMKKYNEKIDLWSVGCVFAEVLLHKPLFDGKCELEMLQKIFKLTGTPTEETWPGFSKLSDGRSIKFESYEPSWRILFPSVRTHFSSGVGSLSHEGLDLMKRLLDPNPVTRISAREAINHPYLTTEKPTPTSIQYMPTVPDTNMEAKRVRMKSIDEEELCAREAFFFVGNRFEGRVDARRYLQRLENANHTKNRDSKTKKLRTSLSTSRRV